jgi:SAM-dependent methyltransferase
VSADDRETNRAHWDALAAVHGQDAYYDAEALVGGADSLSDHEDAAVRDAVGEVDGRDVMHLQCHIGFDSISLARRGARVTGVDFSPASLAKARALAARAGVKVEFVEGDATALPGQLHGRFDLVYSSMGVLCWIEDLAAWMRSVRAALRVSGERLPVLFTLLATRGD